MPVPAEYYHASKRFEEFVLDARDAADLQTTHMAWNMVVGVLHAFRRRLAVRAAHNFTPANAHEAVAIALRHNVDTEAVDRFLQSISEDAYAFWFVKPEVMRRLRRDRDFSVEYRAD